MSLIATRGGAQSRSKSASCKRAVVCALLATTAVVGTPGPAASYSGNVSGVVFLENGLDGSRQMLALSAVSSVGGTAILVADPINGDGRNSSILLDCVEIGGNNPNSYKLYMRGRYDVPTGRRAVYMTVREQPLYPHYEYYADLAHTPNATGDHCGAPEATQRVFGEMQFTLWG